MVMDTDNSPLSTVTVGTDCDDSDGDISPGAGRNL